MTLTSLLTAFCIAMIAIELSDEECWWKSKRFWFLVIFGNVLWSLRNF
jgi:hypothetical protein